MIIIYFPLLLQNFNVEKTVKFLINFIVKKSEDVEREQKATAFNAINCDCALL